jgi:hypothetical protein
VRHVGEELGLVAADPLGLGGLVAQELLGVLQLALLLLQAAVGLLQLLLALGGAGG